MSIFLHESFHGLGIWSNLTHQDSFVYEPTKFDLLAENINNQWSFIGSKAEEIHGGPLPLAPIGSTHHYSDRLDPKIDLMREYGYPEKWQILDIDLELLSDLGHDVIKWRSNAEVQRFDSIIQSTMGQGKLKETTQADAFTFDPFDLFTKRADDKIIGFDALEGDKIVVNPDAFPSLKSSTTIKFSSTNRKNQLKRMSKQDYDFVYFEKKSRLYFDGNGTGKNWGNTNEGGLVVILQGKPDLTLDDFKLLI